MASVGIEQGARFRVLEAATGRRIGRVIDVDREHTARSTVFQPVVIGAVDLREFPVAIATVTGLLDALLALTARQPDAVVDHPLPERLGRDPDVVVLQKLLRSERLTEVPVALTHKTEDMLLVRLGNPIGRRSADAPGCTTYSRCQNQA